MTLPATINSEAQLEEMLSDPSPAAVDAMKRLSGDLLILGAGGKMGTSLARMARRASQMAGVDREVIAVSRFSNARLADELEAEGIGTLRGDLLDERFIGALPDAINVVHMPAIKFGTGENASLTWATNVYLPSLVCRKFIRSRIAAFSTGNVYPLVAVDSGGSRETDPCCPIGEYAMTAVGRERIFQYFSEKHAIPIALIRLNYAIEMRYGVLVDVAMKVYREQQVDVTMGYANVIWQADANSMALAALADADTPPLVLNVAGPERVSIRTLAEKFGELMNKSVQIVGVETDTALLNNGSRGHELYGQPRVSLERLTEWTAEWISRGGSTFGKPTHYDVRDGSF